MIDPLSQMIRLLRPSTMFSKGISGAGRWAVSYSEFGHPGFCAVLEGRCRLAVAGEPAITLEEGDFVLLPSTPAFTMSGFEPAPAKRIDPRKAMHSGEEVQHGRASGPPDVRLQGGYFLFGSPDAALIVSLLPRLIHIHGDSRLSALVHLFGQEASSERAGRDLVLERLVEVLLIEALRASQSGDATPGLLRGLSDVRISEALRQMHEDPQKPWTIDELGREAGLSRSAFFDRFTRTVGLRPMEYLLAWRMALAKDLLRREDLPMDEVARRVGYGSASTFSTAFSRHVGQPPGKFARTSALQTA
ncbi:AraC family transcriptional regulator [Hyphomonas sp. CACIAM 19H1]|uniref:AraC family transcriptional regulator n=1 Tax=Hyphomonas sp. CACIAM 19H1 TaxID=1873716 RepID=UPI000DEDEE7B|nr:AraC family transcriptional regulator [Hyphomonas sp. CACIAM 19H1]AXE65890.1 AraC family transcriptional regulator [Hyphomonas sp. CACIAM 19H1]